MALWFRKKDKKPEPTPVLNKREPEPTEAAGNDSLKLEASEHLPVEPIVPVSRPAGLRSFKLPPSDAGTSPPAPAAAAPSPEPSQAAPPASAAAPDSRAPAPEAPAIAVPEAAEQSRAAPVSSSAGPKLRVAAQPSAPASPENQPPSAKPLLKSIQPKPSIKIADKSDVPVAKTETVAADMAPVSRTDPKALYYQLMNGLYDVVFVLDDDGHVMDCNTRAEEIFGYSADDVWNMPIEKIIYGMNSRMFNLLKKNLTNKRHILIDARCFRSSGTSFLGEVGVSTVHLTRSQNVVFSIRNVERRKNSADELRKYRAVIDTSPMPSFACDLHGRFEVMNPPVLKALGMVDEMEAQKKHFGEMLPDMIDFFQAAVRGEEVKETKEITRPDGTVCSMELRLKPMRKGEEITGVAGIMIFS